MESLEQSDFVYFKKAMDGVAQANSVLAFVQNVLIERYGLRDNDQIQPDGTIVRIKDAIEQARNAGTGEKAATTGG